MIQFADKGTLAKMPRNPKIILLIEEDGYFTGLNWAFGGYVPYRGRDYVVVSMARIRSEHQLFELFAHELGHLFGAARPGRKNTEENLGSHCLNDLCVMQQSLTV